MHLSTWYRQSHLPEADDAPARLFAVRVLMLLACEPSGRPTGVDRLAQKLGGLSQNHLHKIVHDLAALGITRTVWGAGGGSVADFPILPGRG
jgi:DNA-binding IscR family transcriptional regulator